MLAILRWTALLCHLIGFISAFTFLFHDSCHLFTTNSVTWDFFAGPFFFGKRCYFLFYEIPNERLARSWYTKWNNHNDCSFWSCWRFSFFNWLGFGCVTFNILVNRCWFLFLFFFFKHGYIFFLSLFFLKTTLQIELVDNTLAILDILLLIKDRREEEVWVLGESLIFVFLCEVDEQFLRKGHILFV